MIEVNYCSVSEKLDVDKFPNLSKSTLSEKLLLLILHKPNQQIYVVMFKHTIASSDVLIQQYQLNLELCYGNSESEYIS